MQPRKGQGQEATRRLEEEEKGEEACSNF